MQTGIGWIDFSSEHRDRVRSVLDLLSVKGVVDELGIGIIRDAFSDTMFPGITTIQTRPKYFLIVPRILHAYEQLPAQRRRKMSVAEYLHQEEVACRIHLAKRYKFREGLGIIGITFGDRTDRSVMRPASSVYWNGLCQFRIVRSESTLRDYDRKYSGHKPANSLLLQETKKDRGDDFDAGDPQLPPCAKLPKTSGNWRKDLSITLLPDEAIWLRTQIATAKPDTLLGRLMSDPAALEQIALLDENASFATFRDLPCIQNLADAKIQRVVHLATDFWQLLRGAHVRYNVLLNEMYNEEGLAECQEMWDEWLSEMSGFEWAVWETEEVWQLVTELDRKPHARTRRFVDGWIDAVRNGLSNKHLNELVRRQEIANKGTRARLKRKSKDVSVDRWFGFSRLDYRLPQIRQMAGDIVRAEQGAANPDAGL